MADRTLAWSTAESLARMAWLDQGAGNAYLLVYGTTKPADAGAAPGGGALLRVELAKPSGIVQADGSLKLLLASELVVGLAGGTAVWARLFNGADAAGLDMRVSTFAGSAEIRLSRVNVAVGSLAKVVAAALK